MSPSRGDSMILAFHVPSLAREQVISDIDSLQSRKNQKNIKKSVRTSQFFDIFQNSPGLLTNDIR